MLMNLYIMGYLKIIYEVKKRCYDCFVIDMEKKIENNIYHRLLSKNYLKR